MCLVLFYQIIHIIILGWPITFFKALSLTFLQNTDSVDRTQFSTVDERL